MDFYISEQKHQELNHNIALYCL